MPTEAIMTGEPSCRLGQMREQNRLRSELVYLRISEYSEPLFECKENQAYKESVDFSSMCENHDSFVENAMLETQE